MTMKRITDKELAVLVSKYMTALHVYECSDTILGEKKAAYKETEESMPNAVRSIARVYEYIDQCNVQYRELAEHTKETKGLKEDLNRARLKVWNSLEFNQVVIKIYVRGRYRAVSRGADRGSKYIIIRDWDDSMLEDNTNG